MNDETAVRATIERYFAALRAGDRAAWLATFAPEGESEDPAGSPVKRGHEALGAFFDAVSGQLARMEFRAQFVHVCGDRAAVSWKAELEARNGRRTEAHGIDVFDFDGQRRINRVTGFWDPPAAFRALGLA